MSDQYAFSESGAASFMVLPPVPRGLAGLGASAAATSSAIAMTDPTYANVDQLLKQALMDGGSRMAFLDAAYATAASFWRDADFAQRTIDSMRSETRNANRVNFLQTLLAQFERRMAPTAAERDTAQGRFEQNLPSAPPLSAFENVWDKLSHFLDTLGTVGKVGAGLAALYLIAKIAGGRR